MPQRGTGQSRLNIEKGMGRAWIVLLIVSTVLSLGAALVKFRQSLPSELRIDFPWTGAEIFSRGTSRGLDAPVEDDAGRKASGIVPTGTMSSPSPKAAIQAAAATFTEWMVPFAVLTFALAILFSGWKAGRWVWRGFVD
jgi:hypothetical protein